jgi:hypothetical protein
MASVPVLNYVNPVAGIFEAKVILDGSVSNTWSVNINGTGPNGEPVDAKWLIVDNSGNKGIPTVNFGPFTYTVAPYTRKKFALLDHQANLQLTVTTGQVFLTFSNIDLGIPDEINQYAVQNTGSVTPPNMNGFSPARHGADVVLTNSNFTATQGPAGTPWENAFSLDSKTAGKWYIEFTYATVGGYLIWGFGVAAEGLTTPLGSSLNSGGVEAAGTGWYINSVNLGAINPGMGTTGNGKMAIDFTSKKVWTALQGQILWNNANGDPATNSNGFDISGPIALGPLFFGFSLFNPGSTCTVNTGASPFNDAVPTGFSPGW